jgi:hypothetical protein
VFADGGAQPGEDRSTSQSTDSLMALMVEDEFAPKWGARQHGDASTSPALDSLTARIVEDEASADVRSRPSKDALDARQVC